VYRKNTKISIEIQGDGSELFDFSLPQPHIYSRTNEQSYTIEYYLHGDFYATNKSGAYLNDILARFTLSMNVRRADAVLVKEYPQQKPLHLYGKNLFTGLRSIEKFRYRETVENGKDNVFWAIKLYTESLIQKSGEGSMIAYSLLESFAFAHFVERVKDRSTLQAKCRSIWEWYDARDWTIPNRRKLTDEELKMSRQEAAKRAHTKLAADTKKKVQKAIAGLEFMQEKINIANVARDAKVSRDTAKKYLAELGYRKEKTI